VVYFEPHEPSAQALVAQLARLGCVAQRCHSPQELRDLLALPTHDTQPPWLLVAVDAARSAAFLDDAMPGLDVQHVIGMGLASAHVGTTGASAGSPQWCAPRHLIKPVLRSALVSRLGGGPRPTPGAASAPVPANKSAKLALSTAKHVLVVEDDEVNQMIVCSMLHNAGFQTSTANDGAQAMELLRQHRFDVVLMDWQMPDMDGLEVTRQLRAGVSGRFAKVVPIIALTANAFSEDRAACLAAGMNDYLTKPVLMKNLVAAVQRWTGLPGGDEASAQASAFGDLL
jgi:CheY-like chemotaxis protein